MQNYRLYHKKLSLWHDPEQVFLALYADKKYSFWLDNKDYSYMGLATKRIKYTLSNHTISTSNNGKTKKLHQDIFTYLQKELLRWEGVASVGAPRRAPGLNEVAASEKLVPLGEKEAVGRGKSETGPLLDWTAPLFDFTGGFVGYFGYEIGRDLLNNPQTPFIKGGKGDFPDAYLFFIDKFLTFDHRQKSLYLVTLSKDKEESTRWLSATTRQLSKTSVIEKRLVPTKQSLSITGLPRHSFLAPRNDKNHLTFTPDQSRQHYLRNIRACQKHLTAGDAYQICLTNQITADIKINWLALFRTLRATNPAPGSAYINFGNFALISSSPEQFLKVDKKGWVTSKPMKGTVRRGETIKKDKLLAKNLGKTEKDYAENIMIVDLVRSDLGKVCIVGSIKVTKPLEVQTYATAHQLVSTIKGKLRPGATIVNLLEASFPGGSMTGAPKIAACEIIAELENAPRGIYSGTFGFLSLNGTANLAMTIRTIIATKDQLSFGTGGAILSDSIPQEEYNEMLLKAQALIKAIIKSAS